MNSPHPGETLFSYISRLARYDFIPVEKLWKHIAGKKYKAGTRIGRISVSSCQNLESILPNLSPERLLLDCTPFCYHAAFNPLGEQKAIARQIFLGVNAEKDDETLVSNEELLPKVGKLCPACVREDEEVFGEAYFHTFHYLPFINCCPLHGFPLQVVDIDRKEPFSSSEVPLTEIIATEQEQYFSQYSQMVLEHHKGFDVEAVKQLLKDRMSARYPDFKEEYLDKNGMDCPNNYTAFIEIIKRDLGGNCDFATYQKKRPRLNIDYFDFVYSTHPYPIRTDEVITLLIALQVSFKEIVAPLSQKNLSFFDESTEFVDLKKPYPFLSQVVRERGKIVREQPRVAEASCRFSKRRFAKLPPPGDAFWYPKE